MASKIKAVIFNLDDTLIETHPQIWKLHKHVAKNFYNVELTDEKLRQHWGKPLDRLMEELYEFSDTVENMLAALMSVSHKFPVSVKDGSVDVINKLHDRGLKIGIVSATSRTFMNKHLTNFNFPIDKFTFIQTAEDTKIHKPNPDVFLPTFKRLLEDGVGKGEIVYVGDSMDDFKAATAAGIDFIAITTGIYTEEDFKKNGAKNIVSDIKEVTKFLIE
jgi:phosphoglycolate phosphatase-like HAD superfamily hydrolase